MSQITHDEARRLINLNVDQVLDANTCSILDTHLNKCAECRGYASELDKVENVLRKMKHGWDPRRVPLQLDQIISRSKNTGFGFANNVTITKMAMMVLTIIIVVALGTWQFSIVSAPSPTASYTVIPIPTPSTFLTSTKVTINCDYVPYQVQAGDTLDSIASQFSVTKEMIMDFNGMQEDQIDPSMQIRIPLCNHTPTVTINTPNTTITISPQFEPITPTPG